MSDISNRSAYRVTVARRPEHDRTFPFSQAGRTKLAAYIAELRAKGLKPQVAQGTDAWQVRVRRKGIRPSHDVWPLGRSGCVCQDH